MMVSEFKFEFYVNPGKTREDDCYCSAYNPRCPKGYDEECILIKYPYNPYEGIEECMNHSSYKRVNGRYRQR